MQHSGPWVTQSLNPHKPLPPRIAFLIPPWESGTEKVATEKQNCSEGLLGCSYCSRSKLQRLEEVLRFAASVIGDVGLGKQLDFLVKTGN